MTCTTEIHLNDINTRFKVTISEDCIALDISTVSTKQIIMTSPTGVRKVFTASFLNSGTDGIIYYDTVSGDIDEVGLWKIQGYIVLGSGTFHSEIESFRVYPNL